jgi:diguanylate cyclase (GGDEF)-like protein
MAIPLVTALLRPAPSPSEVTLVHKRTTDVAMFLALSNMVVISVADVLINGSIAAYLGSIFAFAAIFLMTNRYSILLFGFNMGLMSSLLIWVSLRFGVSVDVQLINTVTFALVAFVLSRLLFYYHVKDFANRRVIRKQREQLEELSMKDPLTQALNRRSFLEKAQAEMARASRYRTPACLLLFDIDHFKAVNDIHGHCAGDSVLSEVARTVRENIRGADLFARWGGEEFLILSPQTGTAGMASLAEKLREAIATLSFPGEFTVTASFGVTRHLPGESWDLFLQRCDRALYQAKREGRDRVVIREEPSAT